MERQQSVARPVPPPRNQKPDSETKLPPRNKKRNYSDSQQEETKRPPRDQKKLKQQPQPQPPVDFCLNHSPYDTKRHHLTSLSALQQYLQSTAVPMIQIVEINNNNNIHEDVLECLAQCTAASLTEMVLYRCGTARLKKLAKLVRKATQLHTLRLSNCTFLEDMPFTNAMIKVLLRRKSPLRCLEFDLRDFSDCYLSEFMSALGRSIGLERLVIRRIEHLAGRLNLSRISNVIPLLKVKHLTLEFSAAQYYNHSSPQDPWLVLSALKRNYFIQSCSWNGTRSVSLVQKAQVDFWIERNRKLAQWCKDPTQVPRLFWPEAMKMALKAGRESLYLSLVAISKKDGGLRQQGSRKRKRPHSTSSHQRKKHCK